MGGSSKTTESKQTATTQPQTPRAMQEPILNYYSGVDNFLNANPNQFVTPINDIQKQAFNNTGGLFGGGDAYGAAARIAAGVGTGGAPTSQSALATYQGAGNVANAGAQGAKAASMLEGFNNYLDPTLGALLDTTLADFDENAGRQKAAQQAAGARAGAFGGSRFAIGEATLDSELARARAATDAGLRKTAWDTAGQWSQYDAGNRQGASQFSAAQANQAALANAAAANQRSLAELQAKNQMEQFNATQSQQNSQFQANLEAQNAAQRLAAAGLLGDIGGSASDTYRADLAAQLGAGNNLYSLENAAVQAPITQLQTAAGLLNPGGVVNTQTGQIVTGEGTEYAKTNGGLLNGLLGIGSLAAPFF